MTFNGTISGSIEQNLPQPFLMVLIGLSDWSGGPRGQRPLVRELRHSIRLGKVGFVGFFKIYNNRNISRVSFYRNSIWPMFCHRLDAALRQGCFKPLIQTGIVLLLDSCGAGSW